MRCVSGKRDFVPGKVEHVSQGHAERAAVERMVGTWLQQLSANRMSRAMMLVVSVLEPWMS